ncbi:unnamed protein product [Cladocopium goreaui]|uniref:Palmitoyltransferase n=1 Tax=Cladocopium goreaui TaxID=2562237 RepID=A0A9P1DEP4_9DINO|nr:unnamed protein product [Cladocopium goreaui]
MDVLLEVFAVDALDQLGRTPLMHATFAKSAEAMVWLVHRKAALETADSQGLTALHVAAAAGSASLCALLLWLEAPLGKRDLQGRTALGCAVAADHLEVVEQMVLGHHAEGSELLATSGAGSGWVRRCLEHKVGCHELLPSEKIFSSWGPPEPWSCCRKRPEQVQAHPREACVLCGLLALIAAWSMSFSGDADDCRLLCFIAFSCTLIGSCCFFTAVCRSPGACQLSRAEWRRGYEEALRHAAAITWTSPEEAFNWWGTKGTVIHELQMLGPERSKFCTARRQCVPMFDHYCAFLRNSVGPGNYGAFFGCVSSAFLCCVSLVLAAAQQGRTGILCFFAMVALLLGAVLLFHLALAAFALTTWEMLQISRGRPLPYLLDEKGEYRNPYDRGFLRNLKARVFGELQTGLEDLNALSV